MRCIVERVEEAHIVNIWRSLPTAAGFVGVPILLAALVGCGENLAPPYGETLGPPENLKALAKDSSTVVLQWTKPQSGSDTSLAGYQVEYLGTSASVGTAVLNYAATGLPAGPITFSLRTRMKDGRTSDAATITWAAAARYERNYVLTEYSYQDPNRACALDVGHSLRPPLVMGLQDPNAGQLVDLWLVGGGTTLNGTASALRLLSASVYAPAYQLARFSTTSHSSANLDYFLSQYPAGIDSVGVTLADNTIYYTLVQGPNATYCTARLHVRFLGGTFPNRQVVINISLQRSPNILYAGALADRRSMGAMVRPVLGTLP
jgi:hypothetical protein